MVRILQNLLYEPYKLCVCLHIKIILLYSVIYIILSTIILYNIELANSITTPNAFLSTIVTDCRSLMERFESCSLKHIFREANGFADLLAKTGCDQRLDFISFSNAPAYVLEVLAFDVSSATRFHLISS